jgi:endogenous inhibitor of DNA gyrase (YacG/DUF329 family)
MGVVMITCPNTGRAVSTGIETDARSFASLSDVPKQSKCPVCGSVHVWWKREAWLAVDGGGDLPPLVTGKPRKTRKPAP